MGEMKNAYQLSARKPEENGPLERYTYRWNKRKYGVKVLEGFNTCMMTDQSELF
jgi:hypothetical protein